MLVRNRKNDAVVLTRQFRYASWKRGDGGAVLEIPAGIVPPGRRPEDVAREELVEEVGYHVRDLRFVQMFYASPGSSTERVFLYFAEASNDDKVSDGGGVAADREYIEVVELPIGELFEALETGGVTDAKTIIALRWLQRELGPRPISGGG